MRTMPTYSIAPIADPAIERAAVASLFDPRVVDAVLALVGQAAVITQPDLSAVVDAAATLRGQQAPVDAITVWAELRRGQRTQAVGDLAWLMALAQECSGAAGSRYAQEAMHLAIRRQLETIGGQIASLAHQAYDATDAVAQAQALIQRLAEQDTATPHAPAYVGDVVESVWAAMCTGTPTGIPTGLRDYDALTGGLHPDELVIFAARPGQGKTALALWMAQQFGQAAIPALYVSLEMGTTELARRVLASISGVDSQALRLHRVAPGDLDRVTAAVTALHASHLQVVAPPSASIGMIRAQARVWRMQHPGPAALFIDYVQLVRGDERRTDSRVNEMGEVSMQCKAMARELHVPVVILCQLNRAVEGRTSHIPMLADLRESGQFEQDADQVVFLYRDELYDPDTDRKGITELHIAKHRNGPLGVIPVRYDPACNQFASLTYREVA